MNLAVNWSSSWRVLVPAFLVGSLLQWVVFGFTEPRTDGTHFEPLVFIYQVMYFPFTVASCVVTVVATVGFKLRQKPITVVGVAVAVLMLTVLVSALPFVFSIGGLMAELSSSDSLVDGVVPAVFSIDSAVVIAGIGLPFSVGFVAFWSLVSAPIARKPG